MNILENLEFSKNSRTHEFCVNLIHERYVYTSHEHLVARECTVREQSVYEHELFVEKAVHPKYIREHRELIRWHHYVR